MRTLTLALALALSGCSSWHAVSPHDTDIISRARRVRVTAGTVDNHNEHPQIEHRAVVENHYVAGRSSDGLITLRGDVIFRECPAGGTFGRPDLVGSVACARRAEFTYNPDVSYVEVRRANVGRIVGGSILASFILSCIGGAAFSVATR